MDKVFLLPGDYITTNQPTTISTVLGSCLSVVLMERVNRVYGMCHAVLPHHTEASECDPGRYTDSAIVVMINEMVRLGAKKSLIEAHLFGGATKVKFTATNSAGALNFKVADFLLKKYKIPILSADVGGNLGRKIIFNTLTEKVLCHRGQEFADQEEHSLAKRFESTGLKNVAKPARFSVIGLASSTGGTEALAQLIPQLNNNLPPILIVQHMTSGFERSFAKTLDDMSRVKVMEGQAREICQFGRVYIAPADQHMEVRAVAGKAEIFLHRKPKLNGVRPAADYLFFSLAREFSKKAFGVILTGMGRDGAAGMLAMRRAGCFNIAQDEDTSTVFGMPKEAIAMGGVQKVLPLQHIASFIHQEVFERKLGP